MTTSNDTITVYWAPTYFTDTEPSWDFLYKNPVQVFNEIRTANTETNRMVQCPATKALLRKVYSFNSAIDDTITLDPKFLEQVAGTEEYPILMPNLEKVQLKKVRPTSRSGYINLEYGISWALFADEPLVARLTAPYYPAANPVEGALLSPGEFDIGQWYRPMVIDYHIPTTATEFVVKKDQPLIYLEFLTDKKIELKRYTMTTRLQHILTESLESTKRYGRNKPLEARYEMANDTSLRERVLKEIQKTVI